MAARIVPAILSGGAGTRLWPLSTEAWPKQFHALGGVETLFAATLRRVRGDAPGLSFAAPIVLCNAKHADLVRESGASGATLVLEPQARNTAAAAAAAAAIASELAPYALLLLLPADHIVRDVAAFHRALALGAPFARERIVTFGVTPDRAATGYGYIKRGAALGDGAFAIDAFKEKPDADTARGYLETGGYFWNAGIFLFHPQTLLKAFDASPDIRDAALAAVANAKRSGDEIRLDPEAFAQARGAPLDIAVMEKNTRAAVVPCDIGWADIGAWDEVWRLAPRNADGFALLGPAAAADVAKMQASGVRAAAIEGDDLLIVAAPRGLLIAPRALVDDADALKRAAGAL